MKNCLILLTNYFPFYKGEEYLETELPILAKKFDVIYIISCMIGEEAVPTRAVPSNVIVIKSGINHSKLSRMIMLFKSLFIKDQELKRVSILQRMYSKYFEARSEIISNSIIKKLNKIDFSPFDKIVIYSYWIYITASIGIKLDTNFFSHYETKIIARAHGYDLYNDRNKLNFLPARDYIFNNLDFIYPVSDNGTNFLKEYYPEYSNKIRTRRLGTRKPGNKINDFKKKFLLVSCSTVRPLKRLDLLIEALSLLQNKGLEIYWVHLGDGSLFKEINNKAQKILKPGTFKMEGHINNSLILEYYIENKASLFINVSTSEGVPVSIMEAISIGLPVIATDVGGTNEIVIDNKNGLLLNKNISANDLSFAIQEMYHLSDESYLQMSKGSIDIWEDRYNALYNYKNFSEELLNK